MALWPFCEGRIVRDGRGARSRRARRQRRNGARRRRPRRSQTCGGERRLDQVIRSALEGIFDLTEADLALLFLRSADKLFIRGEKHRQPRFQHEDTPVHSVGECLCGLAVSERRALYSRNIHKDPRCTWEECRRAGLVSFAALPLHSGDEVTGVLGLASATERDFGQQAAFLEAASNQIAIGLQNAIFCEHLKDHATRLEQEIAERKQAEERIHQQEERLRRVVENMPVMMDALDENDTVIAWNRECERVTGYSAAEMVGNPRAMEKLYPDPDYLEQVIAEASDLGFDFRGKEWTLICKDGTEKTICWSNISARFPIPGWHTWAIGVDVTERVRAEEERESLLTQIREQARQLQQVLVTVPTGVLLLDAEGRIVQANPAAEKDLTSLADTRVGDVLTHLGDRSLNELLTSPPTKGLWHEIKVNGRIFEVIARPVENGPRSEHWVLVINDATQEREIQAQLQQQERLATVGQLAAGIAHDFNNIMAAITLYAHMAAQSQALSKRHREGMAVIDQQARHAVRLIEQILDFSRRAVLERRPLDFLPLLKEQVKLLERTLPEHIEIALNYGHDEYTVHADPTRMKQMLTNLAVNARDAMPDGGILRIELERVTVEPGQSSIMPEMEVGAWIRLTVSDTGTGIPPDVLPHIFEPFFTTKGPGEGSGLGLAQVHGIVGQHGGRTDVDTQVDEGTTFTIYLPALDVRPVELPLPDVSAKPRGQGQVVLVVEDAGRVRGALAASLEQWNYQVLEAANGKEALAVLEQRGEQVDLVLSDVVMPGMGGMALFHALRERGWETPMILLTGHPMEKELEDLRAQGLTAWLPKPPGIERLAQAVADALET